MQLRTKETSVMHVRFPGLEPEPLVKSRLFDLGNSMDRVIRFQASAIKEPKLVENIMSLI